MSPQNLARLPGRLQGSVLTLADTWALDGPRGEKMPGRPRTGGGFFFYLPGDNYWTCGAFWGNLSNTTGQLTLTLALALAGKWGNGGYGRTHLNKSFQFPHPLKEEKKQRASG